jgi:hypothetical protein
MKYVKLKSSKTIDLNNERMEIKFVAWFCCMKMKLIEANKWYEY